MFMQIVGSILFLGVFVFLLCGASLVVEDRQQAFLERRRRRDENNKRT